MSQNSRIPFKLFQIDPNPFMHAAFAICTSFRNDGGYLKSESFVLIQTSQTEASVFGTKCSYKNAAGTDSPVTFDEDLAMEEAIRQAESEYSVHAHELDPKYFEKCGWRRVGMVEVPQHRLLSIWAHTPHSRNLMRIADATDCALLQQFIYKLQPVPRIMFTPIAL
jgi:hypothetical protein